MGDALHTEYAASRMSPRDELELRRRQLAASEGMEGYASRVEAIRQRVAELEKELD